MNWTLYKGRISLVIISFCAVLMTAYKFEVVDEWVGRVAFEILCLLFCVALDYLISISTKLMKNDKSLRINRNISFSFVAVVLIIDLALKISGKSILPFLDGICFLASAHGITTIIIITELKKN